MPSPTLDPYTDEDERERQYEQHKVVRHGLHYSTAAVPMPPRFRTHYETFFGRYRETAALYEQGRKAVHASLILDGIGLVLSAVAFIDIGTSSETSPGILRRPGEIALLCLMGTNQVASFTALGIGIRSFKQLEERYNFNLRRQLKLNEGKYWEPPPDLELSFGPGGLLVRW